MKLLTPLSLLVVLALPVESSAQASGATNSGAAGRQEPGEQNLTRDTLSQSDLKRLAEKIDQWNRVEGKAGVPPRVARSRTAAMLTELNVSCAVSDAAYRGQASDGTGTHIYEAACEDGMGYLLMLQGSTLKGASCLAAGRDDPQMSCALPANADGKVMAGAVLHRLQVQCQVRDLRWLGASAANLDHIEVACENGGAYVMRSPPLGSGGKLEVLECQDAGLNGVVCQMSPPAASAPATSAESRPSLAWFKDALVANGVKCQAKRARIVGRESIKRRYVVEFECADRTEGLVALVPPVGDTKNPFESMSCQSATGRGIRCELMSSDNSAGAPGAKP